MILKLDGDGSIREMLKKGFKEAHLEDKISFDVVSVDDLGEGFKKAVKEKYNAKYLDDADLVIRCFEPSAPAATPAEETPAEETPPEKEKPAEENPSTEEKPEEETPPEENKPEEEKPEEETPPEEGKPEEEKPADDSNKEEKPEEKKDDKGKEEKVNECAEYPWTGKIVGYVGDTIGCRDELDYQRKALLMSLLSITDMNENPALYNALMAAKDAMCCGGCCPLTEDENKATGDTLKTKVEKTVKRCLFPQDEDDAASFDLDSPDGNVFCFKVSIQDGKKEAQ